MSKSKTRVLEIKGECIHPDYIGEFLGEILFEKREDCIYYTWNIQKKDGSFLGSVSRPVSFRVIPKNKNPFVYALNHAIEGINKYRMTRKKIFKIKKWHWRN